MSLASRTREAARARPFLVDALAVGVVNYTAAARYLQDAEGLDGDLDAVATALRRFADDLDGSTPESDARVTMEAGVGPVEDEAGALLWVGDRGYGTGGDRTAVLARGEVGPTTLETVLGRLRTASVGVEAAGVREGALVVVVDRMDGANAVRILEDVLETGQ